MSGIYCKCLICGKPMICGPFDHNICCGQKAMANSLAPASATVVPYPGPASAAITAALNAVANALPSREMSLAKTKLQEALFWAGKAEHPEREL